jgi:hypothetical protein
MSRAPIREVGLYLARQRCLLNFTLHELLLEHVGEQNGIVVTTTYDDPNHIACELAIGRQRIETEDYDALVASDDE